MPSYAPGLTVTLQMEFFNETNGVLTDPTSIQLDITYGDAVGFVPDYAGPYQYLGASSPTSGQVYRISTGIYAYRWTIPAGASPGIYVANWTTVYSGDTFLGFENITVVGGGLTPPVSGDIGYWTGSITYGSVMVPLGAQDANGTAWLLLGVDGLDGAPTDGQVIQRAGDHGGYPTPQFYAPRPITLRVHASAATQALRDTARALMQQAVPVSDLATLVYNEPVPKTLQVRRSGPLKETYPAGTLDVEFEIGLIAPDPRKYGASHTTTVTANSQMLGVTYPVTYPLTYPAQAAPGGAVVVNNGNFETRPMITVTGPITGPALYNQTSGQTVSFSTLTMLSTDVLVLDMLNKVAYLDGAAIAPDLSSSWWVLPPGTSQVVLQGSGAAGATMTIATQDAWM